MAISQEKIKIARELVESGTVTTFSKLFIYVPKTYMAKKLGIKYARFLLLTKDPRPLRYKEAYAIARILKVSPKKISNLIHNQIDLEVTAGKK